MRASDKLLHEALVAADLPALAERAKAGEWNEYFGRYAIPQNHLVAELRIAAATYARDFFATNEPPSQAFTDRIAEISAVAEKVMDGTFDATRAEADEWGNSDEGRATFAELIGGK